MGQHETWGTQKAAKGGTKRIRGVKVGQIEKRAGEIVEGFGTVQHS